MEASERTPPQQIQPLRQRFKSEGRGFLGLAKKSDDGTLRRRDLGAKLSNTPRRSQEVRIGAQRLTSDQLLACCLQMSSDGHLTLAL